MLPLGLWPIFLQNQQHSDTCENPHWSEAFRLQIMSSQIFSTWAAQAPLDHSETLWLLSRVTIMIIILTLNFLFFKSLRKMVQILSGHVKKKFLSQIISDLNNFASCVKVTPTIINLLFNKFNFYNLL